MGTRMGTLVSYVPCCDSFNLAFIIFTRDDVLVSLCTDAPLPSEKIGQRDVCESPSNRVPVSPEHERKHLIGCNVNAMT